MLMPLPWCRSCAIQASERDEAWRRVQEQRGARLQLLELEAMDFDAAARLCIAEARPLRAGDALHLAVCQPHRSQLVSFDPALGVSSSHHRVAVEMLHIRAG